jgi:hypothetical protein
MRIFRRIAQHQGRRGGILTLFGVIWIFCGVTFALTPSERFVRAGSRGVLDFLDIPWPGVFWIACGLVAFGNGVLRRRVRNDDAIGYAALIMPPALWVGAYAVSFILWLCTRGTGAVYGQSTAIVGVLIFLVLVVIIRIVANWPDDMDVPFTPKPPLGSLELALLDRKVETQAENDARGQRARRDSEDWIATARVKTEVHIAESAAENDRMIQSAEDEATLQRSNHDGDPPT